MGLYNFKPQFQPFILDWSKRHTIRAERKHGDNLGKIMHLYVGLRHPGAICLMRPQCVRTDFIRIEKGGLISIGASVGFDSFPAPYGDGALRHGGFVRLDEAEANQLARCDGFAALSAMMEFWNGRLPFTGTMRRGGL